MGGLLIFFLLFLLFCLFLPILETRAGAIRPIFSLQMMHDVRVPEPTGLHTGCHESFLWTVRALLLHTQKRKDKSHFQTRIPWEKLTVI